MNHRPITARLKAIGAASALCALVWAAPFAAQATTLSDNTTQITADTVAADATNWLAASFSTDTTYSAATLQAVVLALADSGATTLALYSSDASSLVPDSLLANFNLVSTSATASTFSLSDIDLQGNATYWLVLSNASGSTNWSWTEASDGTGSGFTGTWANSDDAGGVWFTNSNLYPLQAGVTVVSAVPEPASMLLWLGAMPWLMLARAKNQGASA
ncbi:MAG: choice-of-anchor R domain-containing protein [Aquabacterium sp.]|uniref:choice-of-anchor R domain-containing protein n=1 Tax=Aquabacterium sp. TaxID=1872578 RepID=UPI002726BB6D|nr:choice-of-anchor R domain-containing protein [Aquabacterium sp.]MDO9005466.1 choice-of-anchor R domain-containing protein [Aquabacterium sp.]